MLPVLQTLAESGEIRTVSCADLVADRIGLTPDERVEMLPGGSQRTIVNRTGWAAWYMMQAGLISRPKRGFVEITNEGRKLLASNPPVINNKVLEKYPQFIERMRREKPPAGSSVLQNQVEEKQGTPNERMEEAMLELRASLVADLRDQLAQVDPFRFEQIVLDLLLAMGYGGSRKEAAMVTQKTGDEGIDGVINEDRLGLDVIYIQAKRWKTGKVGRPDIQNFVGALVGKKANKGIFITTSDFLENARDYAADVQHKIILIDGRRLAELMIDHNIGISEERVYRVKRIDSDYFESSEI